MKETPQGYDPLADLEFISDPQERLLWITERGKRVPGLLVDERAAAMRVPGCVSAVWIVDKSADGRCDFRGDAEAPVLRGLVSLICQRAKDRPVRVVAADPTDVVTRLGLERHLTPTRVNGLRALQAQIRRLAASHAEEDTRAP